MRKLWIVAGLAAAATGVTVGGLNIAAGASEDNTITVWERSAPPTITPHGPPAPGSTIVIVADLFSDHALTHKVGVNHISCTFVEATRDNCIAVTEFTGRGQVMTQVLSLHPDPFDGAIVGGTGEFRGANGEFHVQDIHGPVERTTFDFSD